MNNYNIELIRGFKSKLKSGPEYEFSTIIDVVKYVIFSNGFYDVD